MIHEVLGGKKSHKWDLLHFGSCISMAARAKNNLEKRMGRKAMVYNAEEWIWSVILWQHM